MDDAASCRAMIDTPQFRMERNHFPNRYITLYSTHICKRNYSFSQYETLFMLARGNLINIWGSLMVFINCFYGYDDGAVSVVTPVLGLGCLCAKLACSALASKPACLQTACRCEYAWEYASPLAQWQPQRDRLQRSYTGQSETVRNKIN